MGNWKRPRGDLYPWLLELADGDTESCWPWPLMRIRTGYGMVSVKGRMRMAHRVVYEEVKGQIPPGLEIDHTCSNRWCVNPNHLEAVTRDENVRRAAERRTHCPNGHEYALTGVYEYGGRRRCAQCHKNEQRRRRKRNAIKEMP